MINFTLPEIVVNERVYSILKIIFLVSAFLVVTINVLSAHATFLDGVQNVTDVDFGLEFVDDNLEEQEEIEDEKEHERESRDDN